MTPSSYPLPPRQTSDLLFMSVTPLATTMRRRLAASNATGSLLTVWLLLQPTSGIQAPYAVAIVNQPSTQSTIAANIKTTLGGLYPSASLTVSAASASAVQLLPSVAGTGPASNGNVAAAPGGPTYSVAGLAVGLIFGLPLAFYLFVVFYTRCTGGTPPCGLDPCLGPITVAATCCGACPIRKRRPTSSGPTGLPKVKSWRAAPQVAAPPPPQQFGGSGGVATGNPISSLSLRSINLAPPPPPPSSLAKV